MSDANAQIVAAANILVQWGRARQATWRDASSDLLAALGNRYAAFDALIPEPPDTRPSLAALLDAPAPAETAPSPWDALSSLPESTPVPAYAQVDYTSPPAFDAPPPVRPFGPALIAPTPATPMSPESPMSPAGPSAAPMSAVAPSPHAIVAPPPTPALAPVMAPAAVDRSASERAPAPARVAKPVKPGPTTRAAGAPSRMSVGRVTAAAAVVLLAVASPAVWRAYHAAPVVVAPATNSVTIESTPAGSQVLIDNVDVGKTPFTTTLTLGSHAIEIRYRKNVRKLELNVTAGDPTVTRVDWVKKPAPKKRPNAKPTDDDGGADEVTNTSRASASASVAPPVKVPAPGATAEPSSTAPVTHEHTPATHQVDAGNAPADSTIVPHNAPAPGAEAR